MEAIDTVSLSFDPAGLVALNIILALIMFGVALDLSPSDFRRVVAQPRAGIVGLTTQLLLLPAVTFVLTMLIDLPPSVELGMMLVAACPGGNVSNFMTSFARGNTSLSISMTAVVTAVVTIAVPVTAMVPATSTSSMSISSVGEMPPVAWTLVTTSVDVIPDVTVMPVVMASTATTSGNAISVVMGSVTVISTDVVSDAV